MVEYKLEQIMGLINRELKDNQRDNSNVIKYYSVMKSSIGKIYSDGKMEIYYDEDREEFVVKTTWSGQEITDRWVNKAHRLKIITDDINEIWNKTSDKQ